MKLLAEKTEVVNAKVLGFLRLGFLDKKIDTHF
jgi:hypothetical protein